MSAAVAQAKPAFVVTETLARAGDTVHFSIAGADGRVTYEVEIGDRDVAEGSAPGGGVFAGSFTVPDLGDARRTVKVEAELHDSHRHQKIKHKLEYLGRALPVTDRPVEAETPPLPQPHNPPVVVPEAAPAAASPVHLPETAGAPAAAPAVNPRSTSSPRQSRTHRPAKRRRGVPHRSERTRSRRHRRAHDKRDRGHKKRRARRVPPPRTAPLFDGVPERAAGGAAPGTGGSSGLKAIAPRTAVLAAAAESGSDFGVNAAVMVPAMLALLGAGLVGIAARRNRSRRG